MCEPALKAKEWRAWDDSLNHCMEDEAQDDCVVNLCNLLGGPHAIAAKCLHGQPYGFTWDDVDALNGAIGDMDVAANQWCSTDQQRATCGSERAAVASIRDRITALLPPVEFKRDSK